MAPRAHFAISQPLSISGFVTGFHLIEDVVEHSIRLEYYLFVLVDLYHPTTRSVLTSVTSSRIPSRSPSSSSSSSSPSSSGVSVSCAPLSDSRRLFVPLSLRFLYPLQFSRPVNATEHCNRRDDVEGLTTYGSGDEFQIGGTHGCGRKGREARGPRRYERGVPLG